MMYDQNFAGWLRYRADMRRCNRLLRNGSRSFYAASWLLPEAYRSPIIALYAFCRVADDAIDESPGPEATRHALEELHARLRDIYAGRPRDSAVDHAIADVVRRFDIPYTLPAALLEGFAWDVSSRDYRSWSDVYAYSARVAGTVGSMMALIMGVRRPGLLSRACDLGVAMQLTNIARDVGEDAASGRLYLPRDALAEAGIDADRFLANPTFDRRLAGVIAELLQRADVLYARSEWGIANLPGACRPAIGAARMIYAEIGHQLARDGYDSVTHRTIVPGRRKLTLLRSALRRAGKGRARDAAPPLSEVRFLIDAVAEP
ncbi:MAG: phytoene/squalene synthase family protein [Woeseiaceae bacterium]